MIALFLLVVAPLAGGLGLQQQSVSQNRGQGLRSAGSSTASRSAGRAEIASHSAGSRSATATRVLSGQAAAYFHALESASWRKPVLVPPGDMRRQMAAASKAAEGGGASLLGVDASQKFRVGSEFQPSSEFLSAGGDSLPWGIGSPRTGDSLPNFHYSAMPFLDFPKEIEYSLDSGDNIQTFGTAYQDIKLITQVLENVTNGFYLDTNAGEGESGSNTLLLELTGWRGLITEPRAYEFSRLWSKMRKAWLFLGAMSPNGNATKIGFDRDGLIDMLSGHKIHTYNLPTFMSEMGGRKTVDFWNLKNGGYEAEVLNETLFGSGKNIEFGVILVSFDGRRTGRGYQSFVQMRSKDETEELVFELLHNASFKYIGGLDAYWINYIEPRWHYKDAVFINPAYFQKRGIPIPWKVKAAPPPPLTYPLGNQTWTGWDTWDAGFTRDEEVDKVSAYIAKARADAAENEPTAKAHRVTSSRLV